MNVGGSSRFVICSVQTEHPVGPWLTTWRPPLPGSLIIVIAPEMRMAVTEAHFCLLSPPFFLSHWPANQPTNQPSTRAVSPDARGRVPSPGSAGAGRGLQHRSGPALPRLTAHHLPRDWHQEPLLRTLPEVHANGTVWDCCHTRRDSGDHRWVITISE